jgi:hypothetical protein
MRIFAFCLLLAIAFAATVPFIDMWEEIDDAECHLKICKNICLRVYQGIGKVEPNFAKNLAHLKGKAVNISAYMTPSNKVTAEKQVADIAAAIKNVTLTFFWVSVEGSDWSMNHEDNVAFLKKILAELAKLKLTIGIQTDMMRFGRIMGRSTTDFNKYPLWNIHQDNNPEPGQFRPYGGWKVAKAKQYKGNAEVCGDTVNLDSLY